jgi:hypothetical protein
MAEEDKFHVGKPPVFGRKEWRFTSRPWEEICGEL